MVFFVYVGAPLLIFGAQRAADERYEEERLERLAQDTAMDREEADELSRYRGFGAEARAETFPDMVYVPGGHYARGFRLYEEVEGELTVSYLSRHTGMDVSVEVPGFWIDRHEYHDDNGTPRTNVSWNEAIELCRASGKTLCSQDQWWKACTGTNGNAYPYEETDRSTDEYEEGVCPPTGLDPDSPYEVGTHRRCTSEYGAMDMGGGCLEWTRSETDDRRFIKGGWAPGKEEAGTRCAFRKAEDPSHSHQDLSFRCCIDDDGTVIID